MKIFSKAIRFSLYLAIFFLPLFFLPFSFEAFEFNKIFLLYFLVSISVIFYLLKIIFEKEFSFQKNPLNFLVLIFLFFCVLSAIFSVDRIFSFFGFYGRFSSGLLTLILLILFFFLILESFEKKDVEKISLLFLISSFFVIFSSFFSIFGLFQKIEKLPPLMRSRIFNFTSGSLEGFSIFLAPIIFLSSSLLISKNSIPKKIFYFLVLVSSFSLLIITNFKPAFALLVLSFAIFLISSLISKIFRQEINKLLLSIFLILISILFLFFSPFDFKLPREQILPQKISWQISLKSATESIKSFFLGSGLSTFFYDFSKQKTAEFNKNPLWLVRFDRAGSHLAEILATTGFLGFFSYLILIGAFFLISFLLLSEKPEIFPYVFTFLALFLTQIFYYQNVALAFSFWLFLGISVLSWEKPISKKTFIFEKIPELNLLFNTALILVSILIFVSYYFGYKIYRADSYYLKALKTWQIPEGILFLERAVKLNPISSRYKIDLSNSYLVQALNEIQKPLQIQDQRLILDSMARAINFAKGLKKGENEEEIRGATEISPNWVLAWENLGKIYREIIPFIENPQTALEHGIKAFKQAIELEGKNPILHTELGKLYLLKGETGKAEDEFKKAVELKEDFLDAKIQQALIFEVKGDFNGAIKKMEEIVKNFPFNVESRFQLGRLYFNANRIEEAISQFEIAISIMPNHSNSLYSLGLAFEKRGEKEKALEYFQRVLELNPENPEILRKIEQLKE